MAYVASAVIRRRSSAWALADQGVVSGVNFLTGLALARFLGAEQYGIFALMYSGLLLLAAVQNPVVSAPMMVLGPAKDPADARSYYRGMLIMAIGVATLLAAIMFLMLLVFQWRRPDWAFGELLYLVPAAAAAFLIQDFLRRMLFACGRASGALTCDLISYVGQAVVLVLIIFGAELTVGLAFAAMAATSLLAVTQGLIAIRPELAGAAPSHTALAGAMRENWKLGRWLLAGALTQWGVGQSSAYFVGALLGVPQVGALRAMQNIMGVVNIPLQALENFAPRSAAIVLKSGGLPALQRYLRRVAVGGCAILLAIVVFCAVFAEQLVAWVYGGGYNAYEYLLLFWGLYFLVTFFQRPLMYFLRALGNTRPIFFANLAGLAVLVIVIGPLIRSTGLTGAILAMIAGQLAVLGGLAIACRGQVREP